MKLSRIGKLVIAALFFQIAGLQFASAGYGKKGINPCDFDPNGLDCQMQTYGDQSYDGRVHLGPTSYVGSGSTGGAGGAPPADAKPPTVEPVVTQPTEKSQYAKPDFSDVKEKPQGSDSGQSPSTATSSEMGLNDSVTEFDPSPLETLETNFQKLVHASSEGGAYTPKLQALAPKIKAVMAKYPSCKPDSALSSKMCLESTSPAMTNSSMMITMILGGAKQVASAHDACSNISKALDIAQKGFMAFQVACGAAKLNCDMSCGTSAQNLQDIKVQVEALAEDIRARMKSSFEAGIAHCNLTTPPSEECLKIHNTHAAKVDTEFKEGLAGIRAIYNLHLTLKPGTLGDKSKRCSGYGATLAQSGMGLMMTLATATKSNNCEKQTANATPPDCNKAENKFNVACINKLATLNCADPASANNQMCICQNRPNTPGCPGAIAVSNLNADFDASGGVDFKSRLPSGTSGATSGLTAMGTTGSIGAANNTGASKDVGGSKGGTGASGGSVGAGGGSANFTNDQAAKTPGQAGYDTNLLSGGDGGGGFGGYGSGSGTSADDSKYGSYLPGGKNDPAKLAGAAVQWGKEVSSPGGKSNWEKVRDRYKDNGYSLMGE